MKQYKTGKIYKEFMLKSETNLMRFEENRAMIFIFQKSPNERTVEEFTNTEPFSKFTLKTTLFFF